MSRALPGAEQKEFFSFLLSPLSAGRELPPWESLDAPSAHQLPSYDRSDASGTKPTEQESIQTQAEPWSCRVLTQTPACSWFFG